jgi:tRNA threonylcarbamoyladenosine biosynthesis protein TsaB
MPEQKPAPLLLAMDTASSAVSVALHDGHRVLARAQAGDRPRHAELLAPLVAQVLAEAGVTPADLTAVACGVGPGPFTGLRVGLASARVFGLALDIPVLGVCSLDAVAAGAVREGLDAQEFLVAIDARRTEVYWARYRRAASPDHGQQGAARLPVRDGGPQVGPARDVPVDGLPVAGRGALLYPEDLGTTVPPLDPDAGDLAALALAGPPWVLPALPLYLRHPDAQVPGARKRVRP